MEGISLISRIFSQTPLRPALKAGLFSFLRCVRLYFISTHTWYARFNFISYLICPFFL